MCLHVLYPTLAHLDVARTHARTHQQVVRDHTSGSTHARTPTLREFFQISDESVRLNTTGVFIREREAQKKNSETDDDFRVRLREKLFVVDLMIFSLENMLRFEVGGKLDF